MKIAYLVYSSKTISIDRRHSENHFITKGERGFYYVMKEIEQATNCKIEPCTTKSAYKYDFVLVSFTSSYDVINFAANTMFEKSWRERKFKVIAGGAGCINIQNIQELIDYAFFGRAEDLIGEIAMAGFDYTHESYLKISDGLITKKVRQAQRFVDVMNISQGKANFDFKETSIGCASKCFYCHYTFSRNLFNSETYKIDTKEAGNFIEIEQMKIEYFNPNVAMYLLAIDGSTERLRKIYNRKQTDKDIINFFQHASNNTQCNGLVFKVFTITGMEFEQYHEIDEMIDMLSNIQGLDKKINVKLKMTPFRPSPLTPSEYSSVDLFSYQKYYANGIDKGGGFLNFHEGDKIKIFSMNANEGFLKYFSDLCVIRGTEKTQNIFNLIINPKFYSLPQKQAQKYIEQKIDVTDIIREYDISEKTPTWYLESYTPRAKIKAMRTLMKKRAEKNK